MSPDRCEARPLRQDGQWFLLAVSIAGRFHCVAARALKFDACFKHPDDLCDDVDVRSSCFSIGIGGSPESQCLLVPSRRRSRTSTPLVTCTARVISMIDRTRRTKAVATMNNLRITARQSLRCGRKAPDDGHSFQDSTQNYFWRH